LHKKTHREKKVPDEAKNHDITPIQTEEAVFFPDPSDGDECEHIHRQFTGWAISYRIFLGFIQRTACESRNDLNKRFQTP
jgi:hypothetical protein